MSAMRNSTKMTEMTADTTDEGDEVEVVEVTTSLSPRLQSGTYTITVKHHSLSVRGSESGRPPLAYPIFETTKTSTQEFTLLSRGLSKGLDYLRNI